MHAGDRLHDAPIAQPQPMTVDGLHPADVRGSELREGNAVVAGEGARHAGSPQEFIAEVPIDELVDVAQILQQLPRLAERRGNQLDQRLGEIGCNVLIGERRAQSRGVGRLYEFARGRHAQ